MCVHHILPVKIEKPVDVSPCEEAPHGYQTLVCADCGAIRIIPKSCPDKFCKFCQDKRKLKLYARLLKVIESQQPKKGYHWWHINLNTQNNQDLRLCLSRNVRAFRKLRETDAWKKVVDGGCFTVECKRKPWGWHVHIHAVVYARRIPYRLLWNTWYNNPGCGKYIHFRRLSDKSKVKAIVSYILKYITKGSSIGFDVPESDRVYFNQVVFHKKLFSVFGSWLVPWKVRSSWRTSYRCINCGGYHWLHRDSYITLGGPELFFYNDMKFINSG
jgi:hypothetical protein